MKVLRTVQIALIVFLIMFAFGKWGCRLFPQDECVRVGLLP